MSETPVNPRHSSAKENWGTPEWIAAASRACLGGIDLDPASSAKANKIIQARYFYDKRNDGLGKPWNLCQFDLMTPGPTSVFLNPPGGKTDDGKSKVKLWWRKMIGQSVCPWFSHGLFLSFSIEACQVTQIGGENSYSLLDFPTCFFKRRVDFLDPITEKPVKGNTHSSCITYLPGSLNKTHRFFETFKELGKVTLGYEDRHED